MVQFAPRVLSIVVVRERAPVYSPAPFDTSTQGDTPFPDSLSSGDDVDAIEALGDEIATLAARQRFALLTPRSHAPPARAPRGIRPPPRLGV